MSTEIVADAERAEMEAGFDIGSGIEPEKKPIEPIIEAKTEVAEVVTQPAPPPAKTDDQAELRALIKDMEARMRQQVDKVSGNYGEVKRMLEEAKKAAATPKGAAEYDISELAENFGPELAKAVDARLKEVVSSIPKGLTLDEVHQAQAAARQAEINAKYQVIFDKHPDFNEMKSAFTEWTKTLPDDEQDLIEETESPKVLIRYMTKYKASLAQAAEVADSRAKAELTQKNRVVRAIAPQGAGRSTPSVMSDREVELAAFESVGTRK